MSSDDNKEVVEDEDDEIISESSEYSPKSEFSKALHVSEAVKLARENRAKEMKPGYMNSSLDKDGNEVKTWVADTRKIYIASIDALRSLMTPERLRDGRMKWVDKQFEEEKEKIWNKYAFEDFDVKKKQKDLDTNTKYLIKKNGKKHMPEIDDEVKIPMMRGSVITYKKGAWNNEVNCYWIEILKLYDNYFDELNVLIDSLNYFKSTINF